MTTSTVCLWSVWLSLVAGLPQVELDSARGMKQQGELVRIQAGVVKLQAGAQSVDVPLGDMQELRFKSDKPPATSSADAAPVLVTFVDGVRLRGTKFVVTQGEAEFTTANFGTLKFPVDRVAHLRWGASTPKLDESWNALVERETKKDLLVINRGKDTLDHIAGVVGAMQDKIKFLLEGDEVGVSREKVFGVIFGQRTSTAKKAICQVQLTDDESVAAGQIAWDGNQFTARTVAGLDLQLPVDHLLRIDFSSGNVKYLSQLDPAVEKFVPYWDTIWKFRRDRNLEGGPLRIGSTTFARGISVHSRTVLRYRLGGEFSRFQSVVGIDAIRAPQGDVHVVIRGGDRETIGEGKVLLEADVRGTDAPLPVDLDVTGIRFLEILVDFGRDFDIGDHLDLGDAKLIK